MRYGDIWKKRIPHEKLAAYRRLMDDGVIRNVEVEYDRKTGITAIDYDADLPQEQIREMLKAQTKGENER